MSKIYPFKFLDAYSKDDTGMFFGRDEEISALYQMVFQSNMLMIYGASGTGKTSLIQCGLASKFKSHDWLSLFIRRGNNLNNSLEKAISDAGGITESQDHNIDLSVLTDHESNALVVAKPQSALTRSLKAIYLDSFRPIYLIFDQFEELFILGTKEEQEQFVKTIREILMAEEPVKIIFSIREEYLGCLDDFEKAIPQIMRKKLRVEPMDLDKVRQVIQGVTSFKGSNISLKKGEEQTITEAIFDKIKGGDKTLTIQLPYLQVFMDKLYLQTTNDETRQADAVLTMDTIRQMGDIGDVLLDFLEEQVKTISNKVSTSDKPVTTDDIWKILSPFTTLEGTKEPIALQSLTDRLPDMDKKQVADTVSAFVNSRILRRSEEGDIYELAHDSLAKKIAAKRSEDEIELLEVRHLIKNQVNQKKGEQELFTHRQLARIEACIKKLTPTEEEINLINESRKELRRKRRIRQMQIWAVIISLIVVLIIITIQWLEANVQKERAIKQTKRAELETIEAQKQKALADKAKDQATAAARKALDAKSFAELQEAIADSQAVIAAQQKQRALEESMLADEQKKLAQNEADNARQQSIRAEKAKAEADVERVAAKVAEAEAERLRLVSLSQNVAFKSLQIKNDPQLAALLATEAYVLAINNKGNTQDPQIYSALFQSLKSMSPSGYPPVANTRAETKALQMTANGQADIISADGKMAYYTIPDNKFASSAPLSSSPVDAAWFSPDAREAVTSYSDFSVRIWNTATGLGSEALHGCKDFVRAADFSDDGSTVITGSRDSSVNIWKNNKLQQQLRFPSRIKAVALAANNTVVLAGCEDGIVYSANINDNKITTVVDNAPARINCVAHSSHNKYIVVSASDGRITLLDANGQEVKKITERKSVDFISADDDMGLLAIATSNRQVRIYHLADLSRKPIEILDITNPIRGFALSAGGYLLVACANNTLRCYSTKSSEIKDQLDKLTTRKLTDDEWNSFLGKDINK